MLARIMSLLLIWGLTQNSQEKLLNGFPYFLFRLHHKCHHMQRRISECPAACTKLRGLNPASCISHDDHLRWLFPSTATYDSKRLSCKPTTAWCWDLSTFTFTCFLHAWCALSACWVANPFDAHSWTNMKSAETVILLKTKSSEFSIFKPFIFVVFPHSKIPANTFLWASCA